MNNCRFHRFESESAKRLNRRWRYGISLMEVIFAIGVLLIGIVGLAHVLPVGMHQSADAVSADKSLIAMENLVSRTMVQAETATREGFVIADRWNPTTVSSPENYLSYQPSPADYRYGICVDPWFLSSAYNKRNTTNQNIFSATYDHSTLNGYDRSLFPCYDRCYNPLASPSESLYTMPGAATTAWGNFTESLWNAPYINVAAGVRPREPRFLRVAPASLPSPMLTGVAPRYAAEQIFAAQSAEPAMIMPDKDKTLPAGRRFIVGAVPLTVPVRGSAAGRYSAMSFIVSHQNDPNTLRVSTAVTKNRIPMIDPGATGAARFNLATYTYDPKTAPYYEGEQLAFVHPDLANPLSPSTMGSFASGLGGQVEIAMHRAAGQPAPGSAAVNM